MSRRRARQLSLGFQSKSIEVPEEIAETVQKLLQQLLREAVHAEAIERAAQGEGDE